jgi:hypothetical protein
MFRMQLLGWGGIASRKMLCHSILRFIIYCRIKFDCARLAAAYESPFSIAEDSRKGFFFCVSA